jgi:hypothetical protein
MTRLILASLVLAISILPLYGQSSSLHTDRAGYTTGRPQLFNANINRFGGAAELTNC